MSMSVFHHISAHKHRIAKTVSLAVLAAGLLGLPGAHDALMNSLHGNDEAGTMAAISPASGEGLAVAVTAQGRTHQLRLSDDTNRLERLFVSLDYDLKNVAAGQGDVPPVYAAHLPADLSQLTVGPEEIARRKDIFIRTMLPLVLAENNAIREERRRIIAVRADLRAGHTVAPSETAWVTGMMARYKLKSALIEKGVTMDGVNALLLKVDVIPPSLAIAQAIVESGWGTSRFAREGNAIFGQWTWSSEHDGMVPGSRDAGKKHRIRAFDTLRESVSSYMLNLNRHYAYTGLRKRRNILREEGKGITGRDLAGQLSRYSTKRDGYVRLLRSLIRSNNLAGLDTAKLADSVTITRIDVADIGG